MNVKNSSAKNEITSHGVMATMVIATFGFDNDFIVVFKNFNITYPFNFSDRDEVPPSI